MGVQLWLAVRALAASVAVIVLHACAAPSTEVPCGNGRLDPGEECDDGNRNNDDGCTVLCRASACGDGLTDHTREQCDDRNTVSGDGCDAHCMREGAVCGNGTIEGALSWREQCDDGNTVNGDGCSANCFTETGVCGDGIQQYNEECDDGNRTPGDGCNANCRLETPDGGGDADDGGEAVEGRDGDVDVRDGELGEGVEVVEGSEGSEGDEGGETRDADADADALDARDGWECVDPVCDLAPQCGCGSGRKCTLIGADRGCTSSGFLSEGRTCTSDVECAGGLYCAPAVATTPPPAGGEGGEQGEPYDESAQADAAAGCRQS
jgi:cysteine-rich repeat protein